MACSAALLPFACGPIEPSASLLSATRTLRLPVPSRGGFTASPDHDSLFVFGKSDPLPLAPNQRVLYAVGVPFHATVDRDSGEVTLSTSQDPKTVRLRPVSLPLKTQSGGLIRDGRVYFVDQDDALIHTPTERGVKEDIVLSTPRGDSFDASWELSLDEGLSAHLASDGSVLITRSGSSTPLFQLPAPVILHSDSSVPSATARFALEGSRLTLHAEGLSALSYPISIDPTIITVDTARDFVTGGNFDFDTTTDDNGTGRVVRSRIGNGTVNPVNPSIQNLATARREFAAVSYNGFAYAIGGEGSPSPTIEYFPVLSNGLLGTPVGINNAFSPRGGLAAAAYNGFLYVTGGSLGIGAGGTYYNEVLIAKINPDGSLGSFTSSPNRFTTARRNHLTVVANGYLYVIGGANAAGLLNDIQYAQINADGTLRPFTTQSSAFIGAGRLFAAAAATNDYVYVLGGQTDATGTVTSDVLSAKVNSDGSLGVTGATNVFNPVSNSAFGAANTFISLPAPTQKLAATISGGYLFALGGTDASDAITDPRFYAFAIRPNGSLERPVITTGVRGLSHHAAFEARGNVYTVGGEVWNKSGSTWSRSGSNSTAAVVWPLSTSPADPSSFGSASASANFQFGAGCLAATTYNGVVYVVGGDLGGSMVDKVQFAPLNADGTISGPISYTPPTGLTPAWTSRCTRVVTSNNRLLIVGGKDASGTAKADVFYAVIAGGAGITSFGNAPSLNTARYGHGAVVANNRLYVLGGINSSGGALSSIESAVLDSAGVPQTFTTLSTTLPNPTTTLSAAAVYNNRIFFVGTGNVSYADINGDGTLGAFTNVNLAGGYSAHLHGLAAIDHSLFFAADVSAMKWIAGNPFGTTALYSAPQSTGTFAQPGLTAFNGSLLLTGGRDASSATTGAVLSVKASSAAQLSRFTNLSPGPFGARAKHCTAIANGFVYVLGGNTGGATPSFYSDYQFAKVNDDGTLGAVTPAIALPNNTPRSSFGCVAYKNKLYVVGGDSTSGARLSDVWYASLDPSTGSVGSWNSAGVTLPASRSGLGLVAYNDYLFVVGGSTGTPDGKVLASKLSSTGVPGGFADTLSNVPNGRTGHAVFVNDNHLYVVGGSSGTQYYADVQVAPLGANGSVGAFVASTPLPNPRTDMGFASFNGHAFLCGGKTLATTTNRDCFIGSFLSTGAIGSWVPSMALGSARNSLSLVTNGQHLLAVGGDNGTAISDVDSALLTGAPPRGVYSKLVDFGAAANSVDKVRVNGDPAASGLVSLDYRTAGTNGVWSVWKSKGLVAFGSDVLLGDSGVRWIQLRFTLDDSAAVVMNNNVAGERDVTDVQVIYSMPPPTQLGFTTAAQTVTAGNCSGAITVASQTSAGASSAVSTATTITLGSSTGTATWYADSSCSTQVSSLSLPADTAETTFFFKDTKAGSTVITASASGLGSTQQSETVTASFANGIAFTTNPNASHTAGSALGPSGSVVVSVVDSYGNPTSSTSALTVTLTLTASNGATLSGASPVVMVNGVATFSNLTVTKAGTNYSLKATAGGWTANSTGFAITPDVPANLTWTTQPTNTQSGQPIAGPPAVTLTDRFANVCDNTPLTVTVSLNAGTTGATLTGGGAFSTANGIATFSNLSVDKANVGYTLRATSGSLTTDSGSFNIVPGNATKVVITSGNVPNGTSGISLPDVIATIQDAAGNTVTSSTNPVSIALSTNPTGATLSNGATRNAVNGVATFNGLSIDKAGTGYVLKVSSFALTDGASNAFNINPGQPHHLTFTVQPSNVVAGATISPAVQVAVRDQNENTVVSASGTMSLTITGFATLNNGSTNVVNGVATFPNLTVNQAGTGYRLSGSFNPGTGPISGSSNTFNVTAGPASGLAWTTTPPGNPVAGATFNPSPQVSVVDSFGNVITTATDLITLSVVSGPGSFTGTTAVNAVNGTATFSNLSLQKAGGYTVKGATGSFSTPNTAITVTPSTPTKLSFTTNPAASVTAGAAIPVTVALLDAYNNVCTNASAHNVALSISSGPSGSSLLGTPSGNTTSGSVSLNPQLNLAGSGYVLKATDTTDGAVTFATTTTFTVNPASAAGLKFVQQPSDVVAGASMTPAVTVAVTDSYGNAVGSGTQLISLNLNSSPPGAIMSGTLSVNAVNGVATFSNLSFDKAASGYTLNATSSGLTSMLSSAFTVAVGAPAKLSFASPFLSSYVAGSAIPDFNVRVEDSKGNLVTTATDSVTLGFGNNPSGATLSGTKTVTAANGIATFTGISIIKTGFFYSLTASATSRTSATSSSFNITAGAVTHVAFTVQPSNVSAGAQINPAVQVSALDAYDNVNTSATGSVTLAIAPNPNGATLQGGSATNFNGGVATFTALAINKAATGYTLGAAATVNSTAFNASSTPFDVIPGAPAKLQFKTQPPVSGTVAGVALSPAVEVSLHDSQDNLVTSATDAVTLSFATSPPGATFTGNATVNAVGGVATFNNLSLNKAGNNYSLRASSAALTQVTSVTFSVDAGPADRVAVTSQPPSSNTAGNPIPFAVAVQDAYGNVITGSTHILSAALFSNPTSATLNGSTTGTPTNGTLGFNPSVTVAGSNYSIRVTSNPALTAATTNAFSVNAGAASGLAFAQQPTDAVAGTSLSPPVTVKVVDGFGNPTGSGTQAVQLGIQNNVNGAVLSGTTTVNASSGVATFSAVSLDKAGSGYRLGATATGLSNAVSQPFAITAGSPSSIGFTTTTASVTAATCAGSPVTIGLKDAYGNPAVATSPVTINLTATGLTLFSDDACATSATQVSIPAGQSSASFFFKGTTVGSYPINATSSLGNASINENIVAGGATKLLITSPARTVTAGQCSAAVTLQAADTANNPAGVNQTVTVALSGGSQVTFYSDANCANTAASVTLTSSSSSVDVFFKATLAQTFTFSANPTSTLSSATQPNQTVNPAAASRLKFADAAPTVVAGDCSPLRTVNVTDAFGNAQVSGSAKTLNLTSSGGGAFFSDAACTTAVPTLSLSSGAGATTLYYRHTLAGTPTITVSDPSTELGSATEQPTITPAAATQLAFTFQPQSSTAGQPLAGNPQVEVRDAFANRVTSSTVSVTLALATNAGNVVLAGTTTTAAVAGVATFTAAHVDTAGTGYALVATATGLSAANSATFDVSAGAPAALAFVVQPSSVVAGTNITPAMTLAVRDAFGNLVTTASGSVSVQLANNPAGATLSGTLLANVASGIATFSTLKLDKSGTGYTLIASRSGVPDATSQPFDVTASTPTTLAFAVQPTSTVASQLLAPALKVAVNDAFGNVVPTSSATVVLDINAPNTAGGTLSGTVSVDAVEGVATFSDIAIDKKGVYTLIATSAPLNSAISAQFTIAAGAATQLAFTSTAQSLGTGECSQRVGFETEDDGLNRTPVSAATTVNLGGTVGLSFFSDSSCTAAVTSVEVAANSAIGGFYFKTPNAGTPTITLTATGLRSASQRQTVTGGPPPQIDPAQVTLAPGATQTFHATSGNPPYTWTLSQNNSGAELDAAGRYTAGQTTGVQDVVQVTDSAGAFTTAVVTVELSEQTDAGVVPPGQAPPLNGWACGCGSASGGAPLFLLAALFLFRRTRKVAPFLAVLLLVLPSAAEAARKKKNADVEPVKKEEPKPVEQPAPPPPEEKQEEVKAEEPAERQRSVAILDVEVTTAEKLDAAAFSEMLVGAIDEPHLFHVISAKDIATMIGIERQRQLSGCSDEASSCAAEIAGAVGAD